MTLQSYPSRRLGPLQFDFIQRLEGQGKSINTVKNYRTDLDCYADYLAKFQKSDDLSKVDLPHILEYGKFLQQKYTSDNSRRRRVQTLRLFFDFLLERQIVDHNPVRKIAPSPKFVDMPRPLSLSELATAWEHFLSETQVHKGHQLNHLLAHRNSIIFQLILFGGLKVSHLANLVQKDLSLKKGCRVLISPLKRDPFTINLPEFIERNLHEYLRLLQEYQDDHFFHFDQLFFNANPYRILSGGLSERGIEIFFKEYAKKSGLEMTPKRLRESAIVLWHHEKVPAPTIKEYMDVSPSYSLKRYKTVAEDFVYDLNAFIGIQRKYNDYQAH